MTFRGRRDGDKKGAALYIYNHHSTATSTAAPFAPFSIHSRFIPKSRRHHDSPVHHASSNSLPRTTCRLNPLALRRSSRHHHPPTTPAPSAADAIAAAATTPAAGPRREPSHEPAGKTFGHSVHPMTASQSSSSATVSMHRARLATYSSVPNGSEGGGGDDDAPGPGPSTTHPRDLPDARSVVFIAPYTDGSRAQTGGYLRFDGCASSVVRGGVGAKVLVFSGGVSRRCSRVLPLRRTNRVNTPGFF